MDDMAAGRISRPSWVTSRADFEHLPRSIDLFHRLLEAASSHGNTTHVHGARTLHRSLICEQE